MSLAKVRKLLALAAQENEEGRTAAWMAAKVMREHGYHVTSSSRDSAADAPGGPGAHRARAEPTGHGSPSHEPPSPHAAQSRGHEVQATERGRCWECRRPWQAGERIYKPDRREPVCLECAERGQ